MTEATGGWGQEARRESDAWFWPVAILLLLAQRVPYLLSPNRILDGDEAILGLMAVHTGAGAEVPLFFWGQSYGFSLLEVLPAAAVFRIFGSSSLALSLTMFGLFFVGLVQWERGLRNLCGDRAWSRLLVLGLAVLPVWVVWSLKARGGYVTAFLLSGLVARWMTSRRLQARDWVLTGLILALLLFAQPVWLLPSAALVLLPMVTGDGGWRPAAKKAIGFLAVGFMAGFFPLFLASRAGPAYWRPGVLGVPELQSLLSFPVTLFHSVAGSFYLDRTWTPPGPIGVSAAAGVLVWFLCLSFVLRRAWVHRDTPLMVVGAGMLLSVAGLAVFSGPPPRYFLQASVFLSVGLAVLVPAPARTSRLPVRLVTGILLLVLGFTGSLVSGYRPVFPETEEDLEPTLEELVQTLEGEGVAGVYSMDALLQWQFLFYGEERIPARFASPTDRRPAYAREVDAALASGRTVALIGTMDQAAPILDTGLGTRVRPVGETFFFIPGVQRPLLESLGFRLGSPF